MSAATPPVGSADEEFQPPKAKEPFTAYQKKLFVFLSVATLFEGYDFMALSQILPRLSEEFGLDHTAEGAVVTIVNFGTMLSFWLVRRADKWGRKRVLTITIAGYTLFTFFSGLAHDVWLFAALQMVARTFLVAEWATSMVIAAEEFPASRRGMVIGVIQGMSSLGSIVCAGIVPFMLQTDLSWRTVYFVGIVPLVILAFARRGLKETGRFETLREEGGEKTKGDLFAIWKTDHRKYLILLALTWFVVYIPAHNAVTFWKSFATDANGPALSDGQAGLAVVIAAVGSMPLIFFAGKFIDLVGRKRGAVVIFALGFVGVGVGFRVHQYWAMVLMLLIAIFALTAYMPILNGYTSELFATEHRGAAFAWSNNILGRIGYVGSPYVLGMIADRTGGWATIMSVSSLFFLVAMALVVGFFPETANKELEDTVAMH